MQQPVSDAVALPAYGARLGEALAFACVAHATQLRKGKTEPYVSHILMVAALTAHYGGDEEQVMAAALHDVVEDQGGEPVALEIGRRFGPRVEAIVRDCSDSFSEPGVPKAPWRERKESFLASLGGPDVNGSRLVEACDKLANLRDIVEDVRVHGDAAFAHFRGGRDGTLWYYRQLASALLPQVPQVQAAYERELAELWVVADVSGADGDQG